MCVGHNRSGIEYCVVRGRYKHACGEDGRSKLSTQIGNADRYLSCLLRREHACLVHTRRGDGQVADVGVARLTMLNRAESCAEVPLLVNTADNETTTRGNKCFWL